MNLDADLGSAVVEAGFSVVKRVLLADTQWRGLWHDHIRAVAQSLNQTVGGERLQRRGGGDIDRRQGEAGGGDHAQRQRDACCHIGNRVRQHCLRVRDVRPHADHVGIKVAEKENVVGQMLHRLTGQADHDAGADDVTDRLELSQAAHTFFVTLGGRVQSGEQGR